MLKKLKKLKIPFLSKKLTEVSLDELIVAALEEAKNYPLMLDNTDLNILFKNKFVTENGTQVPPKEFVTKIVAHIESNPPQSTEEFAIFVRKTLSAIPAPVKTKKRWWRKA